VHGIILGERAAEAVKRAVGAAPPDESCADCTTEIVGKRLADGFPKAVDVPLAGVHDAIRPVINRIAIAARHVVERLKPDATADIYKTGVTLTGGCAQLRGIDEFFHEALGLQVIVAKNPANAAVIGAGRLLAQPDSLGRAVLRESVWHWKRAENLALTA
jgi:rod shape-determining protein MreB